MAPGRPRTGAPERAAGDFVGEGFSTEYIVDKVLEHEPAMRQLPLPFDQPPAK
jgi:hypothetical protein